MMGMTVFLIVSYVYPNAQHIRPTEFPRDNIFTDIVKWLYSTDTPTNILPSIHVFNSLAIHMSLTNCETLRNKKYKINHSQNHVWKPQHIRNDKELTKWNPVIKYCMYDMIAVNRSVLQVTEEQDINDAVNSNHKSMPVFGNKTFQNFTFFGELFHTIPYHNIFILLLQINFLIKYIKIL